MGSRVPQLRHTPALVAGALLLAGSLSAEPYESTCRFWFVDSERLLFDEAIEAAGDPLAIEDTGVEGVRPLQIVRDGAPRLCGFEIPAKAAGERLGSVLFVQGNGMLASTQVPKLEVLSRHGFDVLIYDFRGYGCSDGEPTVRGIFADYREILRRMADRPENELRVLYGISWGGIVLLNSLTDLDGFDLLVLDAVPDRLPFALGCPDEIDPVVRLESLGPDLGKVLLIRNGEDRKVKPRQMTGLAEAGTRHPRTLDFRDLGHPLVVRRGAPPGRIPADVTPRFRRLREWIDRELLRSVGRQTP